jgi:hypothetical protein
MSEKDSHCAINAFDEKGSGEGEEKSVASVAPEAQEIEPGEQRGNGNDAEEESFNNGAFH